MKSILSRKGCNSRVGKGPSLSTTEFHGSSTKLHCGPNLLNQVGALTTSQPLALSLRPLSRSVPALPSVVLLLAAGLSASDAMENEADLWEI
jgi:hypothetical protein